MSTERHYVVCIRNEGYQESLELKKIYEVLPDAEGAKDGLLRIVDEDEDYLYPSSWFVPIELPQELERVMLEMSRA